MLGVGQGETFLASDAMALAGVTDQIVYLEEGDVVDLHLGKHWVSARQADGAFKGVERPVRTVTDHSRAAELGPYATCATCRWRCRRRSRSNRK